MLLAALGGALTFWVLSAIVRVGSATPAASRYIYVGAVFIALIAAEAGIGTQVRGIWIALAAILIVGALIANINALRNGERAIRVADSSTRAALTAVEVASTVVPPAYVPEPGYDPQITAGGYLRAIRDLGSPALTLSELQRAPESIRSQTDSVFELAERLALLPVPPGNACSRPAARGVAIDVSILPGHRLIIGTPGGATAAVYFRRVADLFGTAPFITVPGNVKAAIRFPIDRAPQIPWHVRLLARQPVVACIG
jgi:hypothetical protein